MSVPVKANSVKMGVHPILYQKLLTAANEQATSKQPEFGKRDNDLLQFLRVQIIQLSLFTLFSSFCISTMQKTIASIL